MRLALFLFCISFISHSQNNPTKIDSLKLEVEKSSGNKKAQNWLLLGDEYLTIRSDSALYAYSQSKLLATLWKDDKMEYEYNLGMALAYQNKKLYDSSLVYFDEAYTVIPNEVEDRMKFFEKKGTMLFFIPNYKESNVAYNEGLELALQNNDIQAQQTFYANMAANLQQLGAYENALEYEQKSLTIAKKRNDSTGQASRFNNIAIIYKQLGDYETAETYMLKSIKFKNKLGDKRQTAISYVNLGLINRMNGNENTLPERLDKAKKNYLEALRLSEEHNFPIVKGAALANLINIENDLKNFEGGIKYGKQALAFNEENNNGYGIMLSHINLGDSYNKNKQFEQALFHANKGLEYALKLNHQEAIKVSYETVSQVYKSMGNYKLALDYFEKHHKLKDSIASENVKKNVSELEVKYETAEKEIVLAQTKADIIEKDAAISRKNTLIYGGFGLAVLLGLLGYLFYNQQKIKNTQLQKESELKTALAQIETQNKLQEQRLRISRDLHDNIGSQLTFIISSIDNLKFGLKDTTGMVSDKLSAISAFTTTTIYELRDTIWAMNKKEITLEDLQARISNFIEKAGIASDNTSFNFEVSETINKNLTFSSVEGMNIYRIIQEGVNNAIKYADANAISVLITKENNQLVLLIKDNGKGFDTLATNFGNGLANIKKRTKDLKGKVTIESKVDEGTTITVKL